MVLFYSSPKYSVRVYGVEEATTSWVVSAMEEQRIIVEEEDPSEFDPRDLPKNSRHQKKGKERHNNNRNDKKVNLLKNGVGYNFFYLILRWFAYWL